ncbi:MAG: phosphopyruvate hydratase, partial [Planctomycetes bacterium]|nr:phosphopyruvate hydratase [Planctomycetota bacterium]
PTLLGCAVDDQAAIDHRMIELDGTANKSRIGANAVLGVSLACAHAAAALRGVPLYEHLATLYAEASIQRSVTARRDNQQSAIPPHSPRTLPMPMVNMISGGLHAGGNLDFQDFLIMPVGADSFHQGLGWVVAVYRSLGRVLAARGYDAVLVGDEGGYGPRLKSNREAVDLVVEAISAAGFQPGRDLAIALDVASTHFYHNETYRLAAAGNREMTAAELVDELAGWVGSYPIISIEDGCAEDDWDGWRLLTERLGNRVQLIGDDLFSTKSARLARGIERNVANSILIKPNQVGTLTETLQVIAQAKAAGYRTIISARSGETEDTTIAHLAVATAAGQIKIGSVARSERLAKYNELLRIEERLAGRASFAQAPVFSIPAG